MDERVSQVVFAFATRPVSCDHFTLLVRLRLGSRTVLVPCPASDSCPQLVKYVSFFVAIQRAEYCEADSVG